MADYGPIPVSRLKSEKNAVLKALADDRTVLLSRHGDIVAAIEPPVAAKHANLLLSFVTPSSPGKAAVPVLTSTDIGQGSPASAIRRAEEGADILVTHRGKVYGVMTSKPALAPLPEVALRRQAIDAFLDENPDATADELADFTENLQATPDDTPVLVDVDFGSGARVGALHGALGGTIAITLPFSPQVVSPVGSFIAPLTQYAELTDFEAYKQRFVQQLASTHDPAEFLQTAASIVPAVLGNARTDVTPG